MSIAIEKFDPSRNYGGMKLAGKAGGFDCGHAIINKFVRDSLKQQVKAKTSVAWVLTDDSKLDPVSNEPFFAGFYTLTMSAVDLPLVAAIAPGSLPKQVPCTRLVMLGVDNNYKGQKLGRQLLKHALQQTVIASDHVGCRGMYLDADPGALNFYLQLGFTQLANAPQNGSYPMFLFRESFPP
jgi:GNAT superfamily N-acetyltransferase